MQAQAPGNGFHGTYPSPLPSFAGVASTYSKIDIAPGYVCSILPRSHTRCPRSVVAHALHTLLLASPPATRLSTSSCGLLSAHLLSFILPYQIPTTSPLCLSSHHNTAMSQLNQPVCECRSPSTSNLCNPTLQPIGVHHYKTLCERHNESPKKITSRRILRQFASPQGAARSNVANKGYHVESWHSGRTWTTTASPRGNHGHDFPMGFCGTCAPTRVRPDMLFQFKGKQTKMAILVQLETAIKTAAQYPICNTSRSRDTLEKG